MKLVFSWRLVCELLQDGVSHEIYSIIHDGTEKPRYGKSKPQFNLAVDETRAVEKIMRIAGCLFGGLFLIDSRDQSFLIGL